MGSILGGWGSELRLSSPRIHYLVVVDWIAGRHNKERLKEDDQGVAAGVHGHACDSPKEHLYLSRHKVSDPLGAFISLRFGRNEYCTMPWSLSLCIEDYGPKVATLLGDLMVEKMLYRQHNLSSRFGLLNPVRVASKW